MQRKLYQHIAACLQAMANCKASGNTEWFAKHRGTIESLVADHMPSGSGVDCGTKIDFDASKPNRLVFVTSFHHMDDAGGYDGWTDHSVIVTPDLVSDFDLRVTGCDRNDIKEYLGELFANCLGLEITEAQYRVACGVEANAA